MGEFRREFGGPDEVQVNTPLRPSPVRPLRREEGVLGSFEGMRVRWVYGEEKPDEEEGWVSAGSGF